MAFQTGDRTLLAGVDVDPLEEIANPRHPRIDRGVLEEPAHLVDRVADQLGRDPQRLLNLPEPIQARLGFCDFVGEGINLELDRWVINEPSGPSGMGLLVADELDLLLA